MKTKAGSLKRSAKLTNLQTDQRREKREKIQITRIRNEREDIITDFTKIRIIKEL